MFSHLPENNQKECWNLEQQLRSQYHLTAFYSSSTADNYRENLYYLQMLESGFESATFAEQSNLRVLDTGPSHWFYIQALRAFFINQTTENSQILIDGYEIDPYRLYADFYSRFDHAKAHIREADNISYHPGTFQSTGITYDVVISFFPFVFLHDHLRWGLPFWNFQPEALLEQQISALKPGGYLLIANQGEKEQHRQLELLAALQISPTKSQPFTSPFYEYDYPRFLTLVRKDD